MKIKIEQFKPNLVFQIRDGSENGDVIVILPDIQLNLLTLPLLDNSVACLTSSGEVLSLKMDFGKPPKIAEVVDLIIKTQKGLEEYYITAQKAFMSQALLG